MRKATFEADDAWSKTFLSALKAYPDLPADGAATSSLMATAWSSAPANGPVKSQRGWSGDPVRHGGSVVRSVERLTLEAAA